MQQSFDILIAGAGPAGATCAIQVAKANPNLSIALIDKGVFPRDKICGDALSPDVVFQVGLLSEDLAKQVAEHSNIAPMDGLRVIASNGKSINVPIRLIKSRVPRGYTSMRLDFDNLLFQHAKKFANVHAFEGHSLEDVAVDAEGVTVTTDKATFKGKIVLGADGAHSLVARKLGRIEVDKRHHAAGLRVYYEGVEGFEGNFIELHFLKEILPGYLWVFPMANNRANVGIGMLSEAVSEKKVNLKKVLQEAIEHNPTLKARFKNAKPMETVKGYGLPLGGRLVRISGERFLLAGDAASLIDPFTGEGIGNAIRSGRVAAEHLLRCFDAQQFSDAFNKAYDEDIYKRMRTEFMVSYYVQRIFNHEWLVNAAANILATSQKLVKFTVDGMFSLSQKHLFKTKVG